MTDTPIHRRAAIAFTILAVACGHSTPDVPPAAARAAHAAALPRRACALLSAGEVGTVVGHAVRVAGDGSDTSDASAASTDAGDTDDRCLYLSNADGLPSASSVLVSVSWHGGPTAMAAARAGLSMLSEGGRSEPVARLGDEAVVASQEMPQIAFGAAPTGGVIGGGTAALWLRRGAAVVNVAVTMEPDARAKAVALARRVVGRL